MRRVCRVLDEPLCCARWPQQDGELMGQKQAPPVSSHTATKSQNCTVWLWNVNGDKADIKQVKTLQTEKWKLPLKTTTQGMLGLVIFLVCLFVFFYPKLNSAMMKNSRLMALEYETLYCKENTTGGTQTACLCRISFPAPVLGRPPLQRRTPPSSLWPACKEESSFATAFCSSSRK